MKVLKNELLKQHTSFRVGGPAKVYVVPESIEELEKLSGKKGLEESFVEIAEQFGKKAAR